MGLYLIAASSAGLFGPLFNIAYVALGLGAVIFVHELGHFLVAKACGVKCEKFYLGFDVFGLKLLHFRYGETEYGIGALPLGGYVKMLGQDDNPANAETERQRSLADGTSAEGLNGGATVEKPAAPPALDPRSYQAKSVPQRMAIISAGVIMNIIFAVIFAAVAYRLGVTYTPCIIGGTVPGDPAWEQNWAPGTQIMQIGRNGYYDDQLRFDKDLKPKIVFTGDQELELKVLPPGGEEKWVTITPVRKAELRGYASLGVRSVATLKIKALVSPNTEAGAAALAEGDVIQAVNQVPVHSESELRAALFAHVNDVISLTVSHPPKTVPAGEETAPPNETRTVKVEPVPMRWLGLTTTMGPVLKVRPNSPAKVAGFQEGDQLVTLNGEPVGDSITLSQRVYQHLNQEVTIEVKRVNDQGQPATVTLKVKPQTPVIPESDDIYGARAAVESLGLAYGLTNTVASVAAGSPAAKAGFQVGDELSEVELVPANEEQKLLEAKTFPKFKISLGPKGLSWFAVHQALQATLPQTGVKLTYVRGNESMTTEPLLPVPYASWHDADRGLILAPDSRVRTAASWSEAMWLGFRETKESMGQVLSTLGGLVTGKVKPTDLGGPGTIFVAASSEASVGLTSLLIFLTLLSANLAIVNFLPIPVLDGGHFVFLTYEGLRGKPPNERVQLTLTYAGLAFLLLLMVFVFSLDIHRGVTWLMG